MVATQKMFFRNKVRFPFKKFCKNLQKVIFSKIVYYLHNPTPLLEQTVLGNYQTNYTVSSSHKKYKKRVQCWFIPYFTITTTHTLSPTPTNYKGILSFNYYVLPFIICCFKPLISCYTWNLVIKRRFKIKAN